MLFLYPSFLAAALQTPLTRVFLDKRIRIAILGISVALFFLVMLGPIQIGGTLLYLALSLLFGFALVASVQAWRNTAGAARSRAAVFSLAFGFRDICWGFVYGIAVWELWSGTYTFISDPVPVRYLIYLLGTLFAVPMIAYGILRTQLFDIDLKIRWTIKQSTVASIFIAVMFMVSEGASQFLSDELGKVTGLLAAGVLMFFLAPLQRFAENVASKAMPKTKNTPEYAAHRKMQVYEAAVAEALPDGNISERERVLLNSLRDSLGILPVDAEALERELQKRSSSDG
jgi:hypothetical protein